MIDRDDFEDRMRGHFPPARYPHTTTQTAARGTLQALHDANARARADATAAAFIATTHADGSTTTRTVPATAGTCQAAQDAMEAAGLGAVVRVTPPRGGA